MPRPKRPVPNSPADIKARIQEVKKMRTIGTALQKVFDKPVETGEMAQQALKLGIPEGEGRRYRQFATMYGKPELEDLYRRCRIKKFAITTTLFRVLIGVGKKNESERHWHGMLSRTGFPSAPSNDWLGKRRSREVNPAAENRTSLNCLNRVMGNYSLCDCN